MDRLTHIKEDMDVNTFELIVIIHAISKELQRKKESAKKFYMLYRREKQHIDYILYKDTYEAAVRLCYILSHINIYTSITIDNRLNRL